MSKQTSLGAHSVVRSGKKAPDLDSVMRGGRGSDSDVSGLAGRRLATKGSAIPSLGYDVHDPNLPFGRATIMSIPDTETGSGERSVSLALPSVVAPVIDKLVAALAERDRKIAALEKRIDAPTVETPNDTYIQPLAPFPPLHRGRTPSSVKQRLQRLFRRTRYGREVEAVLAALDNEMSLLLVSQHRQHRWALEGLELLADEASMLIIQSRKTIERKIKIDKSTAFEIFMHIIYAMSAGIMKTKSFKDTNGNFSVRGQQILSLWHHGASSLLALDILSLSEINQDRRLFLIFAE